MKAQQQVILQRSQTDFLCLDPALAFWIFPHALPLSDSCWTSDFWTSTPACDLDLDFSPAPLVPLPVTITPGFDPCLSDQVLSFAPAAYLSEMLILVPVPGLLTATILQGSGSGPRRTTIQVSVTFSAHGYFLVIVWIIRLSRFFPVRRSEVLLLRIAFPVQYNKDKLTVNSCVWVEIPGPLTDSCQYNLAIMDPSPTQEWRSNVEGAIAKLEAYVREMTSLLTKMSVSTAPFVVPEVQLGRSAHKYQVSPSREPRLLPPEAFGGESGQCRPFLTQCEIHFELQPSSFPSERARVAFVISLLTGKAKIWGAAEWQQNSPNCYDYSSFAQEFIRVFDPSPPEREAARGLWRIKQGTRRVNEYIIDFHALAAKSGWNGEALCDAFYQGLNEQIKDELATRDPPRGLAELEALASRIDQRLYERRQERGTEQPNRTPINPPGRPSSFSAPGRERRMKNGLSVPTRLRTALFNQRRAVSPSSLAVFVDSGADTEFMDASLAQSLKLRLKPSTRNTEVQAIDGHVLHQVERETEPVKLIIGGKHHESIMFLIINSPDIPVILGATWLRRHNPHLDWVRGEVLGWSSHCLSSCLQAARPSEPASSKLPREEPDTSQGRLYPLSGPEEKAMREYISEALQAGIIRPSSSPAGAGFFFVGKKDGSLRPCIDFRGLNDITVKNRYPLPLMNTAFERIQGATVFTKLDLRNAYHLVRIREGDEWKTAFNTPTGHYEYLVMPFGLTNAPAVFQALVNDVLRDMIGQFVFVYLDDILIFSKNLHTHVTQVRSVLLRLLQNNLFAKAEKCEFHVPSTSFLGFVISPNQLSMEQSKISAVLDWPVPSDRKQLQRFLGFANFYRRFIRNYSIVASPLHALTSSKSRFEWNSSADQAFKRLKYLFTSAPVLHSPDLTRQFIVEVDASDTGVGAVLSQRYEDGKTHPCAFFSRRLSSAERNYDVGDRELLAVKLALEEWRHWLEGAKEPFMVWTDHKNLQYLRTAKRLNPRQARWALFFSRFVFTLSYRPGSKNVKPDALSRIHEPLTKTSPPIDFVLPSSARLAITRLAIEERGYRNTRFTNSSWIIIFSDLIEKKIGVTAECNMEHFPHQTLFSFSFVDFKAPQSLYTVVMLSSLGCQLLVIHVPSICRNNRTNCSGYNKEERVLDSVMGETSQIKTVCLIFLFLLTAPPSMSSPWSIGLVL
uniref:Reverse transcriptase domain-containing protein n=1 Tax=Kryptolebias marmoratus TaxID=37003 RepID=A0A3Q3A042_KRYMA